MEVVFCNQHIYIIVYTTNGVVELFKRRSGQGDLMVGDSAYQFRHESDDLLASHPEGGAFGEFVDHYSAIPLPIGSKALMWSR